jgi:hypothetical protein
LGSKTKRSSTFSNKEALSMEMENSKKWKKPMKNCKVAETSSMKLIISASQ